MLHRYLSIHADEVVYNGTDIAITLHKKMAMDLEELTNNYINVLVSETVGNISEYLPTWSGKVRELHFLNRVNPPPHIIYQSAFYRETDYQRRSRFLFP